MLEESLNALKYVKTELSEYLNKQKTQFTEQEVIANKQSEALQLIINDKHNPIEIQFLAAHIDKNITFNLMEKALTNLNLALLGMTVNAVEVSVTIISEELSKLKNPSAPISISTEKISALEQNLETLKAEMENIKPTMTRLKQDYAKRKRWLNEHR